MKKLKVLTVVGTRPEVIRLSRIMAKLDKYCDHIVVHTGQNYDYELNQIFFDELGIRKPNYFLNCAGGTTMQTISKIIGDVDKVLEVENPDAFLVLGDTNSCLSVIPAKRRKIPIFHMEAGNRCFDMRVPEEVNRRIIDHTSDVNLVYSDIARECLLREGLPVDLVIKTGSPMAEVLAYYKGQIESSDVLERLSLSKGQFFLISAHREENIDDEHNFEMLVNLLNFLADEYRLPVIVSTHPRTQKRAQLLGAKFSDKVHLLKPLGFYDYIKLQISASAVLSDSGTITEESSILNFPALNLRQTHERHEGMEEAAVMMVGLNPDRISQALAILKDQGSNQERLLQPVSDYSMLNVSDKVARIILSYTDYVNRVIWKVVK